MASSAMRAGPMPSAGAPASTPWPTSSPTGCAANRRTPALPDLVLSRRHFVATGGSLALPALLPFLGGCGGSTAPPTALKVYLRLTAYERAYFPRAILPPFERARNVRV